ncbi:MAG: RsmE family RNA methyltransferase [Chitinophagaceae bacterium]
MALPFFYIPAFESGQQLITLDEDTSKHIVNVLRMQQGEQLHLTNGEGYLLTAEIVEDHRKKCVVKIVEERFIAHDSRRVTVGISLLKNANRLEWFLEKATEIGVNEIIPLLCERTERQHFRYDRMHGILVSALLQSQQVWLPQLHEPQPVEQVVQQATQQQKFIAHCLEEERTSLAGAVNVNLPSQIILIGPEGDFSKAEIDQALAHEFAPVILGDTRLRTETAGVVAATLLKIRS